MVYFPEDSEQYLSWKKVMTIGWAFTSDFLEWWLRGSFQLEDTVSKGVLTTETAGLGAQYEVSVLGI